VRGVDGGEFRKRPHNENDGGAGWRHWILNGTKNWITHSKTCDVAVVIARTAKRVKKKMRRLSSLKRNEDSVPERRKINWACAPAKSRDDL
jgi:alkylation response protein AidB-like acyl-CoA dehydrogenase